LPIFQTGVGNCGASDENSSQQVFTVPFFIHATAVFRRSSHIHDHVVKLIFSNTFEQCRQVINLPIHYNNTQTQKNLSVYKISRSQTKVANVRKLNLLKKALLL